MPAQPSRRTCASRASALARPLAVLLAVALLAAGCGGSPEDAPERAAGGGGTGVPSPGVSAGSGDDEPAPDPGFEAPKVGQCFAMTAVQTRASVASGTKVRCRRQHTSVVAHVGYVPEAVTSATPVAARRALGNKVCAPAYRKLVGGTVADRATSILTWTLFTPTQAQLDRGARWVRCDVFARSADRLVPLPTAVPLLGGGVPEQLRVCQTDTGVDISCSRPHAFRVEAVFRAADGTYPDPEGYTATARDRCEELTSTYGGYWQPPSKKGWKAGDRFIRCLSAPS